MSQYSERFTLTLNASVADIAARIGKAMDSDVGGEYSFVDNGDGTITCDTPCVPQFKQDAEYLMQHPELLHWKVAQEYESRWSDLVPPTLEECQAFIAAIIHETSNQEYTAT